MRGIILAGGTGTRLRPLTTGVSKQLLPIYDKPMIYYPLTTLMLAGIREVLLVTTPNDVASYRRLLDDGTHLGMNIDYVVQPSPEGLPQAFLLAEPFLGGGGAAMILGDNLLVGPGLGRGLSRMMDQPGGVIFAIEMNDPRAYGVVDFDNEGRPIRIEEKPLEPTSRWAIPGLYFYDGNVVDYARELTPSARGELEIVDLHRKYLDAGTLHVEKIDRGAVWLDMGTIDSLTDASEYVRTLQARQGLLLGSPEEVAWKRGWIDSEQLASLTESHASSTYGRALRRLLDDHPETW